MGHPLAGPWDQGVGGVCADGIAGGQGGVGMAWNLGTISQTITGLLSDPNEQSLPGEVGSDPLQASHLLWVWWPAAGIGRKEEKTIGGTRLKKLI